MWKKTCKIRIKTKTKAKSSLVGERKKNPLAMSLRKKLSFVKLAYPVAQKKKEKKRGMGRNEDEDNPQGHERLELTPHLNDKGSVKRFIRESGPVFKT